jgi:hypothetical protein
MFIHTIHNQLKHRTFPEALDKILECKNFKEISIVASEIAEQVVKIVNPKAI